jgi:hypothetical protein
MRKPTQTICTYILGSQRTTPIYILLTATCKKILTEAAASQRDSQPDSKQRKPTTSKTKDV